MVLNILLLSLKDRDLLDHLSLVLLLKHLLIKDKDKDKGRMVERDLIRTHLNLLPLLFKVPETRERNRHHQVYDSPVLSIHHPSFQVVPKWEIGPTRVMQPSSIG